MDYSTIGRQIHRRRVELKLTQEKLAEQCDLSVSYMGAVERGDKIPSLETFIHIANVLGVSADQLLSGVLSVGNSFVASELSHDIAGLADKEQKLILDVIQTMISNLKH